MNIERARKDRTTLKGRLTRIQNKLHVIIAEPKSTERIATVNVLIDQAADIFNKYEQIQNDIIDHIDENQMELEIQDFSKIEEQFMDMRSLHQQYTSPSPAPSRSSSVSTTMINASSRSKEKPSMLNSFYNVFKSTLTKKTSDKGSKTNLGRTSSSKSSDFYGFSTVNSTIVNNPHQNIQDWMKKGPIRQGNPVPTQPTVNPSNNGFTFKPFTQLNRQFETVQNPAVIQKPEIKPSYEEPIFTMPSKQTLHDQPVVTTQQPQVNSGDLIKVIDALSSNIASQSLLPQLPTVKFSGNGVDWPEFRDIFLNLSSKLHNDMDRLTFLKIACKGGDADRLVKFYNTEKDFKSAWDALVNEYDQEKMTIMAHIKKFIHQKPVLDKSAASLKQLYTTSDTVMRQLQAINYQSRDLWLITILVEKLDPSTAQAWSIHSAQMKLPTMDEFLKFLSNRHKAMEFNSSSSSKQAKPSTTTDNNQRNSRVKSYHTKTQKSASSTFNVKCIKCTSPHWLHQCPTFSSLTANERVDFIKSNSLCFNCFKKHENNQACTSRFTCRQCQQRHHTLLHGATNLPQTITSHVANILDQATNGIIPTAIVNIVTSNSVVTTRILVDTASSVTLISESLVQLLKLKRRNYSTHIIGSGDIITCSTRGIVTIDLQSTFGSSKSIPVEAIILPKVTGKLPSQKLDTSTWNHLSNLTLADPTYMSPGNVDIILGVQYFMQIVEPEFIQGPPGTPDAMKTMFGWVVLGDPGEQARIISAHTHVSLHNHLQIDTLLRKFWEVEEIPTSKPLSDEEQSAEDHFVRNTIRTSEGRFEVKLPFKFDKQPLGNSYKSAVAQALTEEKRCERNPIYKQLFYEFMDDINNRGHWEEVPESQINVPDDKCYYMKRHGVLKESSSTTKLRVVVNASSPTSNNISLNDNLMTGPKVQRDLLDIMLRKRTFIYVFMADIEKMYRMIQLSKTDADFQRLLHRKNPDQPFKHYRLTTVIYGTRSAPFQATRALVECARIHQQQYPQASETLLNDAYVDDITSGSNNLDDCKRKMNDLKTILSTCGFSLRKWAANDVRLLANIPNDEIEVNLLELGAEDETQLKVLGIWYDTRSDEYKYRVSIQPSLHATRRTMLSELSRIFDPFGILQPVIVIGKIIMQSVWQIGSAWDDILPDEISNLWSRLYESGRTTGNIVAAKTRVAPIKPLSIAKLELCAAAELAKLVSYVTSSFHHLNVEVYAFTDSTTVMAWLCQPPRKWKTFVAHRVSNIIEVIPPDRWWHVPGTQNPADIGSRGMYPSEFLKCRTWFDGPEWLYKSSDHWPISRETNPTKAATEQNNRYLKVHHTKQPDTYVLQSILSQSSNYDKTVKIMATVLKAVTNFKIKSRELYNKQSLTSDEYQHAELVLIQMVQSEAFSKDIESLQSTKGKSLSKNSTLLKLHPFVDSEKILRVGGRLEKSTQAPYNVKHPMILPGNHEFTKQLAAHLHLSHCHAGSSLLTSILHQNYWIMSVRQLIKNTIFKCYRCYIIKKKTSEQLMGSLPSCRVDQNPTFLHVGTDYAGPISMRMHRIRGAIEIKAYICIFICMVTKAVHLEVVEDLTTEGFLAAFMRFIATRGMPTNMYSDQGTNYVGADNELTRILNQIHKDPRYNNFMIQRHISWHFNPARSPHFGGLWESNVKCIKKHFKQVVGEHKLTLVEMQTLVKSIEACLNSRPICSLDRNPDNFDALTPAHFIIGRPMTTLPQRDLTLLKFNRLQQYDIVKRLYEDVWRRWKSEYLHTLQERNKWNKEQENLKIDDLVVIKDENTAPSVWPLGRIINIFPDKEGLIRVVEIKTAKGTYKRAIHKVIKLPDLTEDVE